MAAFLAKKAFPPRPTLLGSVSDSAQDQEVPAPLSLRKNQNDYKAVTSADYNPKSAEPVA